MTALTVRLPNSLHAKIREFAALDGVSVNQFIASVPTVKIASVFTVHHLGQEVAQGQPEDFDCFLRDGPALSDAADQT